MQVNLQELASESCILFLDDYLFCGRVLFFTHLHSVGFDGWETLCVKLIVNQCYLKLMIGSRSG